MDDSVHFREAPWPVLRNAVESLLLQHRPHTCYGFSESDVTTALTTIAAYQRELRIAVSFHAFALQSGSGRGGTSRGVDLPVPTQADHL